MKKISILFIILTLCLVLALSSCKGDTSIPKSYTVRFVTNNDDIKIDPVTIKEGYHITGTSIDLNKMEELSQTSAIFRGWYEDDEYSLPWDVDTYRVSGNMKLYAKWSYPVNEPSEVEVSSGAFANSICWIQDNVDSTSNITVKLLKAKVVEKQALDPNTNQTIIYEEITYPASAPSLASGKFTVDGYNVTYTFDNPLAGGIYRAYIETETEAGIFNSEIVGLRFKGIGTQDDPYQVYTEDDLIYLTTHSFGEGTYAILKNDVTLRSVYADKVGCVYDGVFNGNAKTVKLKNNSGVFFELGEHAEVYGLKLSGSVSGSDPSLGTVANYNNGFIHNCESTSVSVASDGGTVNDFTTLSKGGAGGIVGTNKEKGRITLCTVTSGQANIIKGKIGIGGIAGINYGRIYNFNSTITPDSAIIGAYNGKEISSTVGISYAGCAVGVNYGEISQVNVDGKINARRIDLTGSYQTGASNIGGICGYNTKTGTITECLFQGMRIVGDTNVGGICGFNEGKISSCFTGRRIRKPSGTTIEERMFISPVIGSFNVGGIVGKCGETSVITNCYSTANVWCYGMKGYTIAEKCDNCIGITCNQNPRLTSTYLGRTYGQVYSNDLTAPLGENNLILDNTYRINSVEHNLLGADLVDGKNKMNTQLVIKYLTHLGDKFGWNNTYGISLLWQSANTHDLSYYGGE